MKPSNILIVVAVAALVAACAVPGGSGSSSPGSPSPAASASACRATGPESAAPSDGPAADPELVALTWSQQDNTSIGDFNLVTYEATYELTGDEGVIVTVLGPSATAVETYTGSACFHFELAESLEEVPNPPEPTPDTLSLGDLAEPSSESLLIRFQLTPAAAEEHRRGVLIAVIDPTLAVGRYHNYAVRDPLNDTVTVSLSVRAGPGVEARLYRACSRVGTLPKKPPATPTASFSRSGTGKFDLVVYGSMGTAPQTSTYQLRGAWAYDYGTDVTTATSPVITC
jgi:hypothetical protein